MTTGTRTILDLSAGLARRDLENAVARAERANLVNRSELLAMLDRNPGHAGVAALRAILHEGADPALTRSEAEERFLSLIRRAQLPVPRVNVRVGAWEVDFLWHTERLVVEVDGFAFHSSLQQFESDRRRDAGLTARGLRIMRITWRQLTTEPEAVLVRLAQALLH